MSFWKNLFGLDRVTPQNDDFSAHLTTVYGNGDMAVLESLLRSESIPYRSCERGAGGVVRVVAGYNMYGTDVFVHPGDLERARELIEAFAQNETDENSENEDGTV